MRQHRRRRVTPYSATTGASEASVGLRQLTPMRRDKPPFGRLLPLRRHGGISFVARPPAECSALRAKRGAPPRCARHRIRRAASDLSPRRS